MTDLNSRIASGAAWMVLLRMADRTLGVISTLILARLLVPADFGLVAMAMTVFAVLEVMGTFSFDMALIQKSDAGRSQYDTAWTFTVLYGLVSAAALCALAMPAAHVYAEPRVEAVLYALGLCAAVQGFENIGVVAFQKDLELRKEFRFRLIKRLSAFVLTLVLAWTMRSYWALVLGTLFSRLVGVWLSFHLHPYRPRLSLSATGELLHFSKWMLYNNLLVFTVNRGTDFVIGKFAGAGALGTYSVAYEISNLPTTELVYPIMRAVFPGYARMAGDRAVLRQSYLDVLGVVALASVPIGLAIGVMAEPLVLTLLGDRWREAVPLIRVLAVYGVVRACTSNVGSVFLALGRPKLLASTGTLSVFILIPLVLYLVPIHGALGAAWGMMLTAALSAPVLIALLMRAIALRASALVLVLWRPFVAGSAMVALSWVLLPTVAHWAPPLQLILLALVSTVVYAGCLLVLWRMVGSPRSAEAIYLSWIRSRLLPRGKLA